MVAQQTTIRAASGNCAQPHGGLRNVHHRSTRPCITKLQALCSINLVTLPCRFVGNETFVVHQVGGVMDERSHSTLRWEIVHMNHILLFNPWTGGPRSPADSPGSSSPEIASKRAALPKIWWVRHIWRHLRFVRSTAWTRDTRGKRPGQSLAARKSTICKSALVSRPGLVLKLVTLLKLKT